MACAGGEMSADARTVVAVAGASLIGLFVALELRSRGRDVVVLERRAAPPRRSSMPAPVPLEQAEQRDMRAWLDRHQVYPSGSDVGLDADGVDADGLWHALVERALVAGVRIVWERRVLGVHVVDGAATAVRTDAGETAADAVVVAAGAEAVGITPALGLQLPVIPEHSAWMRLADLPGSAGWRTRAPSDVTERNGVHLACVWCDGDGSGLVGAYRSFGAAGDRRDALARAFLVGAAGRIAPEATVGGAPTWRLHAHTSADHLPVVGVAPRASGVVLALPHGPFGNARAVDIARRACDAVTSAVTSAVTIRDHPWSLARFPQAATGGRMEAAR